MQLDGEISDISVTGAEVWVWDDSIFGFRWCGFVCLCIHAGYCCEGVCVCVHYFADIYKCQGWTVLEMLLITYKIYIFLFRFLFNKIWIFNIKGFNIVVEYFLLPELN